MAARESNTIELYILAADHAWLLLEPVRLRVAAAAHLFFTLYIVSLVLWSQFVSFFILRFIVISVLFGSVFGAFVVSPAVRD